ncbi:ABC transporter permease [Phytomonospora endophytica]|uniref:Transport permease protein n=1 Tax=Phytomonospora endophytica TaxID=714109 RepID=A0A841FCK1_9ACTN|nr:ABC transporter permease [Phytomonospora endophytica]MBB6033514.1 ABC-type multidrug transport system permease subunit [Phytomonospora endophytica]GIG64969.1 transport permease protein [Phytomonospora endophytica]
MSTLLQPTPDTGVPYRVRWAITDAWTLTTRETSHWLRQPFEMAVGLLFPIMFFLMFGYLIGGDISVPGGGDYREALIPGTLAMTMMFGVETTMTAMAADTQKGVTDRFRSMPMSASAVVMGRATADLFQSALSLVALVLCGLLTGWTWHDGLPSMLLALVLLLWLRFAMLWIGVWLGLVIRSTQATASVQILVYPLAFLSNVFASPESMPAWLGALAEWNPVSATAAASRELFGNPGWGGDSWAAAHPVLLAALWPLVITAVFLPLSVRRYRRLSR